jgi:hypothetical protein
VFRQSSFFITFLQLSDRPDLIGFGQVGLKSPNTGREVDWLRLGFSPRKANLSLYMSEDINHQHAEALKKLDKHKTGVGCL